MASALSSYLDIVRFAAAFAVFFSHLAANPFATGSFNLPLRPFGTMAVTIFFVLSGYVISYVIESRERSAKSYYISRVSRLYSVVLVALPLTFVFDFLGVVINASFYENKKVLWDPVSWQGYLSDLFFVNEFQIFQFDGVVPGTNAPYWSLSFEAVYYVVAGAIVFFRWPIWIPFCILIFILAGKTIVVLFPVWVLGCLVYKCRISGFASRVKVLVGFLISAAILIALPVLFVVFPFDNFGFSFPWGRGPFNRNLLQDYVCAIVFAIHLIFARMLFSDALIVNDAFRKIAYWLGSLTFPLYCFHFPLICFFAAVSPWERSSILNIASVFFATLGITIVLTPRCERLKQVIRDLLRGKDGNNSTDLNGYSGRTL